MKLSISYRVPLQVIVDLNTGKVHRVVVIDEGLAPERGEDGKPAFMEVYEGSGTPTPSDVNRAYELAEKAEDWPAWDHGL